MKYNIRFIKKLLHFKQPAGTSRGIYTTRKVWYIIVKDNENGRTGIGECAPLPNLSCDDCVDYDSILESFCKEIEQTGVVDRMKMLDFPSMLFGFETAFLNLRANSVRLWDTPFSNGKEGIPINGLIWMGNFDEMFMRIQKKLDEGFGCIKVKIGAIDFEKEIELLNNIRKHFSKEEIELRVDANGAFSTDDVMNKLERLSHFSLHSIEQPIRAGQTEEMRQVCELSPIPVALDEELIGINRKEDKIRLLDTIKPQYIILKPSLHGGIAGSEEWIHLAKERNIGYWITSALESNIGLNAIAQWCATREHKIPQGLGTGLLFTDNVEFPLEIRNDSLWFNANKPEPEMMKWIEND